jgi:ankyrin repeat protein
VLLRELSAPKPARRSPVDWVFNSAIPLAKQVQIVRAATVGGSELNLAIGGLPATFKVDRLACLDVVTRYPRDSDLSLLDVAAAAGCRSSFDVLLMFWQLPVTAETMWQAIAGGDRELVRDTWVRLGVSVREQGLSSFIAVGAEFHREEIFNWLVGQATAAQVEDAAKIAVDDGDWSGFLAIVDSGFDVASCGPDLAEALALAGWFDVLRVVPPARAESWAAAAIAVPDRSRWALSTRPAAPARLVCLVIRYCRLAVPKSDCWRPGLHAMKGRLRWDLLTHIDRLWRAGRQADSSWVPLMSSCVDAEMALHSRDTEVLRCAVGAYLGAGLLPPGLMEASVTCGDVELVRAVNRLLPGKADLERALELAAERGFTSVVEELIALGADPGAGASLAYAVRPIDVLRRATLAGRVSEVRRLLATGVDPVASTRWGYARRPKSRGVALRWGRCAGELVRAGADPSRVLEALACADPAIQGKIEASLWARARSPRRPDSLVELLLRAGASLDATDRFGDTPLMGTMRDDTFDTAMAERLLAAGATPEGRALMKAVSRGHEAMVELLLGAGAAPDPRMLIDAISADRPSLVPLLIKAGVDATVGLQEAVDRGCLGCVRALLATGADVAVACRDGRSLLEHAVLCPSAEVLSELLRRGLAPGKPGSSLVSLAISRIPSDAKATAKLTLLLRAGADPNVCGENGVTPLLQAVGGSAAGAVAALLEAGADPDLRDARFCSPLRAAVQSGQASVVRSLLRWGASWEEDTLRWALDGDSREVVRLMLDAGCLPCDTGESDRVMRWAVSRGAAGVVKQVIAGLPNGQDPDWWGVMLQLAIETRLTRRDGDGLGVVTSLLELGVQLDGCLGPAVARGDVELVQALLEAKADPEARDHDGRTALHRAAESGATDVIRALLAAGADVNALDHRGVYPLMMARDAATVELLLSAGADPRIQACDGRTAMGSSLVRALPSGRVV